MWRLQEIQGYKPREYKPLLDLYDRYGLSDALPERRAEFLAENVIDLTATDHEVLMRKAGEGGRASALNLLEDMVIEQHRERIRRETSEINLQATN